MLRNKSVPTSYSQRWVTMLRKNRKADWTMGEHPPEQFQFVTFYTHFHPIFNSNRMNLVSKNNVCQGLFKHDLHWKVGGHAPEYVPNRELEFLSLEPSSGTDVWSTHRLQQSS